VPVVLIFTKFDALEDMCYNKLRSQGKNHQEAEDAMHEFANKIFQNEYLPRVLATDFPPKAYICLAGNILFLHKFVKFLQILEMNKEENQCFELSEKLWIFLIMMFWSICLFQHKRTILICVSQRALSEHFILLTFKISILNINRSMWTIGS
jgi:hypothetical protein